LSICWRVFISLSSSPKYLIFISHVSIYL
jgi:hypothetical protein